VPWRNLKYSTDWHLLTRKNSYNASKQKRHNAKDTNQFIFGLDHGGIKISWWRILVLFITRWTIQALESLWLRFLTNITVNTESVNVMHRDLQSKFWDKKGKKITRHLGIPINIKNMKFVKDLPMIDAQFN
jgi:hypothetical protein